MLVAGFPAGAFATNCYVLAPAPGQACVVVDPGQDAVEPLERVLAEHDLTPVAVLLTHGHFDHTFSVAPVCDGHDVPAFIHAGDRAMLSDPGCPFPRATAAATAGVAGMVVGAGPKVSEPRLRGMTCVTRNALRVCIDPPPLHGAFQNRGLQILTARVYLPGQRQPDVIEVGLYGTGRACAAIVDSMVAAH